MKGCDKMLKINTKKLVFIAIMMALGIVLKSFLSIGNNSFRISLWNIPIFFAGIVGGPIYGGICALGADLIYGFCFSSYPFSAIMTLTCVVWGISGGLFFKKNIKFIPLGITVLITCLLETTINSIYLYTYFESVERVLAGLPLRLLVQLVRWPLSTTIIYTLYNKVLINANFENQKERSKN